MTDPTCRSQHLKSEQKTAGAGRHYPRRSQETAGAYRCRYRPETARTQPLTTPVLASVPAWASADSVFDGVRRVRRPEPRRPLLAALTVLAMVALLLTMWWVDGLSAASAGGQLAQLNVTSAITGA